MKKTNDNCIPVVIAFDHNYAIIAGVCITSLFYNAGRQDAYRVICLIDSDVTTEDRAEFKRLTDRFAGHEIVFMETGDSFTEAYLQGYVTRSTYYRLLIPRILSEYKKVIYTDVDIIFRGSLHDLYFHEDIEGLYLGVVKDVWMNLRKSHVLDIGCPPLSYFNAGFLVMNIEEINKDHMTDRFMELIERNYEFMDQDILNVACQGRVRYLSPKYNGPNFDIDLEANFPQHWTGQEIAETGEIVRHYAGTKPWNSNYRGFSDLTLWWLFYWRTPFLDKRAWMYYTRYPKISIKRYFYIFKQMIKWIIRYK